MPRIATPFLVALLLLGLAPQTQAQVQRISASPDGVLDAGAREQAVQNIAEVLGDRYVFAELGERAGHHVLERLQTGAYDEVTEVAAFAERLTQDLQSVTNDKHMRVRPIPPDQPRDDPQAAMAAQRERARQQNYGFYRVERLDGNIGYLDLRGFAPVDVAEETAAAAMRFLANVDALIVDLRQNGGGSPAMVQFLCSYFFDERTHLNSLYWREGDRTDEFWTLDDLPGPKMADVPVYVLTSDYTFSGAEEFSYNLRTRDRATLVGETTGGGANPGGSVPVSDQLLVFVPTGRAINPVTGTNWEGVGVEPHVAVPSEDALDRALVLASEAAEAHRAERTAQTLRARTAFQDGLRQAEAQHDEGDPSGAAASLADALRAALAADLLGEMDVNRLGYRYLQGGNTNLAIAAFQVNVDTFPESANVHDSLGEGYMEAGERDKAIAAYEHSLRLDPSNENGRQMLARLRGE